MCLESFDGKVHDQTVLLPEGKGIIGQRDGAVVAGWQLDSERAIVQKSRGDWLRSEGEGLPVTTGALVGEDPGGIGAAQRTGSMEVCAAPCNNRFVWILLADDTGECGCAGFLHEIEDPAVLVVLNRLRGGRDLPRAVNPPVPIDNSTVVLGQGAGADDRMTGRGDTHQVAHPGTVI